MYTEEGELREDRQGRPIPRLNLPTPCSSCPRDKPENEEATTLTPKNYLALGYYLKVRASFGKYLDGKPFDELSAKVLQICDAVVRNHEATLQLQIQQLAQLQAKT